MEYSFQITGDSDSTGNLALMSDQSADRPVPDRLTRMANGVVAVYWVSMFVGTHIPNPDDFISPEVSDKLLHFSAYFVLTMLIGLRCRLLRGVWPPPRQLVSIVAVCSVYAVLDELLQAIPIINRHADPMDALADMAGGVSAATLLLSGRRLAGRS